MNELLIYMVKSALYLAGFYTIYFLFLSRDTRYERNRTFILFSIVLSFILPLITISIRESGAISYFGKTLSEIFVTAQKTGRPSENSATGITALSVKLIRIYVAGMILFGIKLAIDILTLFFLIIRKKETDSRIIYLTGYDTAGFSAMGYIFINRSVTDEDAEEIIRHEKNHLNQNHFYDILFLEAIKIFQWFNPVIYLFNRSLRAIHEYQADEGCINSGMTIIRYQNLLVNHIFRSKIFISSNSFSNPSLLKKRMIMMTKSRSGASSSFKLVFVFPVAIFLLMVNSAFEISIDKAGSFIFNEQKTAKATPVLIIEKSPVIYQLGEALRYPPPPPPPPPPPATMIPQNIVAGSTEAGQEELSIEGTAGIPQESNDPGETFVVVEEMPSFPGGDNQLMKFINGNIQYPEKALQSNISGRVVLKFAVTSTGEIGQVLILKGFPELNEEAIRVIKMLPRFKPGRQGGKAVNVWYNVPVTFQLK